MQREKDEIRKSILKSGKEAFLKNGFEKASIRKIAAEAKVSKSNIYNYFRNKDELFCMILKPTINIIYSTIAAKRDEYKYKKQDIYSLDGQRTVIKAVMEFVYNNKDDFILLLFKSEGSSYHNFRDIIKDEYTKMMEDWLEITSPDSNISHFFIESIATFYINTIAQLIIQNKSPEEVQNHFREFLSFIFGGWNKLLESGEKND